MATKVETTHGETLLALTSEIRDLLQNLGAPVQPELLPWSFAFSASGFNLVVPPEAGQRIFVAGYLVVTANNVTWTWGQSRGASDFQPFTGSASSAAGNPGQIAFSANGGAAVYATYPVFVLRTEPSYGLAMNLSAAVAVGGHLTYWKS